MRIGSFFLVLLAALVALGYLLSDSIHLREDMSNQQKEIQDLALSLQRSEQEKQIVQSALQVASQKLQSCQQTVEQSKQFIAQITNENTYLKDQNRLLTDTTQSLIAADSSTQSQAEPVQATVFSLATFMAIVIGSIVMIGLKSLQTWFQEHIAKTGHYVYLTNAELGELVQRRRNPKKSHPHY